ncbi:MAG: type II toxin-antitoxin system VapC family toxin [Bauldia sp.]|uniref:type II toxin-antitoxin system VapC family toxin n=1 Tax=Bauldia sp. TaxID=2575872 RepID=UPI001E18D108|nr:type II toxin-antitoxin system VapC family toxin [Bauldia sp.]MCB1497184.1 type II toxin-antitoxin system VapC family toxin [Bauldia sp.]
MSLVLDASIALAWVYSDERNDAVEGVLEEVLRAGASVPAIWRLDVGNSLELSVRRGRIDRTYRDAALSDLSSLNIVVDAETSQHAWSSTMALAERFGLTLYDAAYLDLAERLASPLASLDNELRAAGQTMAIPLLGR